jgi:3-dehydroquinate dehydratase-2
MAKTIYVLNGPNLNLLGTREPQTYGSATLADAEALTRAAADKAGLSVEFRQSNHEGVLIDWIHEARAGKAVGLVINPGGYTHTSIALLDAILASDMPTVEIHVSNIHARESFRGHSYVSKGAKAVICGFGIQGYALAVTGLASMIEAPRKA